MRRLSKTVSRGTLVWSALTGAFFILLLVIDLAVQGQGAVRASEPRAVPEAMAAPTTPAQEEENDEEDEEGATEQAGSAPVLLPPTQPSRGVGPVRPGQGSGAIRPGQILIGGVRAARLFAGPGQYPPEAFAAYGILAFPARAAAADLDRHSMLCEAYVAALPHTEELPLPLDQQMVTVWPVNEDKIADELNGELDAAVCERAITNYHLPVALQAIREAGRERIGRGARGPFLLAWSPAETKGDPQVPVLMADLSEVTTYEQARAIFVLWRTDIEANPEYWDGGWSLERLRIGIRLWVDRVGPQIFAILGA